MSATRSQANDLFTQALAMARAEASQGRDPRSQTNELATRLWGRIQGRAGAQFEYRDARNAVLRALRARDTARALTEDPTQAGAALARDYPLNPGIRANQPRYEYRTVVRGIGNGRQFETAVVVRSSTRLSADEVSERAARAFVRVGGSDNRTEYGTRVRDLGATPQIDTYIISASQFAPTERD